VADGEQAGGGRSYRIGDVGAGARVVQGEHNTWIEAVQGAPGGDELRRQIEELLARIAKEPGLGEDDRELVADKTRAVATALGQAGQSPEGLRRAIRDARVFLSTTAGWAWDGLRRVLESDAAQKRSRASPRPA
jgi:hypothetical protein